MKIEKNTFVEQNIFFSIFRELLVIHMMIHNLFGDTPVIHIFFGDTEVTHNLFFWRYTSGTQKLAHKKIDVIHNFLGDAH